MKNKAPILLVFALITLSLLATGCGKNEWKIGKGDPQFELQKCLKLSGEKRFEEAVECLEIFRSRFPQSAYANEAEVAIGDNYFNNKEYLLAADSYLMFVKMHPTHPKVAYAYYRLGLSYLKESPKAFDRDQQYLDKAISYLRVAVSSFPDSEYHEAAVTALKEARLKVAKRTYYIGNFYYKSGQYLAAMPRFFDVINDYPETEMVPKTLYKMVVASGKLNNLNDAKLFYSKLSMQYPDSKWTPRAEKKLSKYVKKYKGDTIQSTPEHLDIDSTDGGTQ
jgi:outer membrane protein assembly factor BamD